ncbi:hypothetical protein YH66_09680 [[Brevibacterium] flavum]|uniref:Uncharacterized protein n=1 Tax=[Brevibacterium] flavum TaxID=92706 RepID=A0A0F6Z616_9CORY|nr:MULTISPECIES: hypothetical protein [Corynebacterium]AKF27800.1 hypothetical protein YH66_09680 [[Brevibacterium] flavum]ANE08632.1 hypothetical protein A3654_09740 [Corynebacterium glutamicum]AST21045.1 hypothetical protein CEY17_09820 [Corynebacterium glutamicum ATCC 14067]KEI23554.1 hypothetical protein KIQ_013590 [Corynebacterium glutamicum ATCC 14067]KIH73302.1 hypothetical protein SD36_09710 [Corynebacterium glutamicum]
MAKKKITRTVQFWRLVDSQTGLPASQTINWHAVFNANSFKPFPLTIEGRAHTGTVRLLSQPVIDELQQNFPLTQIPAPGSASYGVVLAADKDYIPNQHNQSSGAQQPVGVAKGWAPVDNLFVWHLPFGDMIAVLAESQSSSRAGRYASWITAFLKSNGVIKNPDFHFIAAPVIDSARAKKLKNAKGLKAFTFGGDFGKNVANATGIDSVVAGPKNYDAIRIKIEAKVVSNKGSVADEGELLQWFDTVFGQLAAPTDGQPTTAKVKMVDGAGATTEVDLIKHRMTRKRTLPLEQTSDNVKVIEENNAFLALVAAANQDMQELYTLR